MGPTAGRDALPPDDRGSPRPTRRGFLAGVEVAIIWLALPAVDPLARPAAAATGVRQPPIHPRSEWAAGLNPRGPLSVELPGDVRFLLVHHSASSNEYDPADVPGILRGFFHYHVGGAKGWPDIAYNYLIDRYGGIWEGRQGSLSAPVRGDATGGSQGYALLACFIGDHQQTAPSPDAQFAMVNLLAWLADRYAIDTSPGASTVFVSRGSNKWPAGTLVRANTISGHRDMSQTTCPGDAAYAWVRNVAPRTVTSLPRATATEDSPPASTGTSQGVGTSSPPSPGSASGLTDPAHSAGPNATTPDGPASPVASGLTPGTTGDRPAVAGSPDGSDGGLNVPVIATVTVGAAGIATAGVSLVRKSRRTGGHRG